MYKPKSTQLTNNHQCFYDIYIYQLKHKNTLFVGKQESIDWTVWDSCTANCSSACNNGLFYRLGVLLLLYIIDPTFSLLRISPHLLRFGFFLFHSAFNVSYKPAVSFNTDAMVILQKLTTPVCQNTAVRCRKECWCYHGNQNNWHFRGEKLGDSAAVYNILPSYRIINWKCISSRK